MGFTDLNGSNNAFARQDEIDFLVMEVFRIVLNKLSYVILDIKNRVLEN